MIGDDILIRLPDQARAKILLLDGLASDADDAARSAQGRLNNLGRQYPGVGDANPNIVRLAARVQDAAHRHRELFDLAKSCERWVRALPPDAPLDVVPAPGPPSSLMEEGEALTPEEAVMKIRAQIGELTIERMEVARLPEPKDVLKQRLRAQVATLAANAAPMLSLAERGKAEVALFRDPRSDFGISEQFVIGALAWLDGGRMIGRLEAMIDAALPDGAEALSDAERQEELNALDRQIENLERCEEALVESAYQLGTDILRRQNASPPAVLGVRLRVVERPARRPRPPRSGVTAPAEPVPDPIDEPPSVAARRERERRRAAEASAGAGIEAEPAPEAELAPADAKAAE